MVDILVNTVCVALFRMVESGFERFRTEILRISDRNPPVLNILTVPKLNPIHCITVQSLCQFCCIAVRIC